MSWFSSVGGLSQRGVQIPTCCAPAVPQSFSPHRPSSQKHRAWTWPQTHSHRHTALCIIDETKQNCEGIKSNVLSGSNTHYEFSSILANTSHENYEQVFGQCIGINYIFILLCIYIMTYIHNNAVHTLKSKYRKCKWLWILKVTGMRRVQQCCYEGNCHFLLSRLQILIISHIIATTNVDLQAKILRNNVIGSCRGHKSVWNQLLSKKSWISSNVK